MGIVWGEYMESFSALGRWWTPDLDNEQVTGTITFERDGAISLILADQLLGGETPGNNAATSYPIIFGETNDGKVLTLREVILTSTGGRILSSGHMMPTGPRLRATGLFIGAHLALGSDTLVSCVKLVFNHLADWFCGDQIFAKESISEDLLTMHVDYSLPSPVEFQGLGGTVIIGVDLNRNSKSHEETVVRKPFIMVQFATPLLYKEIHELVIKPLQYFLTLVCGAPAHLQDFSFWVDGEGVQLGENWVPSDISVAIPGEKPGSVQDPYQWELLLPLSSIGTRIEDIFLRWSQMLSDASSALDLFCSIFLGPQLYLETRFLYAVQALEVYHRRCSWFENNSMPLPEWKSWWKRLRNAAATDGPDLVQWTNERYYIFGIEKHLRQRLEELVEHGGAQAERILRRDFVAAAKNTRNKLTHHDPNSTGAEGEDLFWLSEEAVGLMEACILRDLGMTQEEIIDATNRTRRTRNLVHRRI